MGKTALAAPTVLRVPRCWPGPVVITTAPTDRQVQELLWREARGAHLDAKVPLGGRMYHRQARWEIGPQRYALGFSPDNTRPERFQGFHAGLIVFVIDEASGVPEAHWEAIKGSALAGNTVIFAIGNPTRTHGEFFDAFHGKQDLWRTLRISAFDTPNFTKAPGTVPGLVGPEAVEEARKDWGEGSSLWDVRILGQFPTGAGNSLIHLDWLEQAKAVEAEDGPYALGVDVARSGNDETVLILLRGNRLERVESWRGQDTMKTAGRVREYWDTCGANTPPLLSSEPALGGGSLFSPSPLGKGPGVRFPGIRIAIDDGGVGGGVVDRLREQGVAVDAITFGAAPKGRMAARFRNRVSEKPLIK